MSDISNGESKRVGRSPDNYLGPWGYLDQETRERYEAIEARVREKVARGEL